MLRKRRQELTLTFLMFSPELYGQYSVLVIVLNQLDERESRTKNNPLLYMCICSVLLQDRGYLGES